MLYINKYEMYIYLFVKRNNELTDLHNGFVILKLNVTILNKSEISVNIHYSSEKKRF